MKIFFYEHKYLRNRHIDLVKNFDKDKVSNLEYFNIKKADQVNKKDSLNIFKRKNWKQIIPFINLKLRPSKANKSDLIFIWGGLIINNKFIVEIDNPWAFVGFNLLSMNLYKNIIKKILFSNNCIEIRCISQACRRSLVHLFGDKILNKTSLNYPHHGINKYQRNKIDISNLKKFKILFIGSQFLLKGGPELLEAFQKIKLLNKNVHLTLITHLPNQFKDIVENDDFISCFKPNFNRDQIFEIMKKNHLLVHPSYMESFGMTVLEAMANSLPIITNDIYALKELVDSDNGYLLKPPITKWNNHIPNKYFDNNNLFMKDLMKIDKVEYVNSIYQSIKKIILNHDNYNYLCNHSYKKFVKLTE